MKNIVFTFILLMLTTGCTTPGLKPVSEELLAHGDEKMLWRQSLEEQKALSSRGFIYQDKELEDYLNQISRKLQKDNLPAGLSIRIFVIKDPYLNAFALPNGAIYVHTGMLARMDNEAQLAALLAHEMSHCTRRHALLAFRGLKEKSGWVASVQDTLASFAMVRELAGFLGVTGSMATVRGYTREFETEADMAGLDALIKADYDPIEALNLFEHMKAEIEDEHIIEPYFFGTHPKVQERIDNIKDLLETRYPGEKGGIRNTELFLSKVGTAILDNALLDLKIGRFSIARRGVEKYLRIIKDNARGYYLMGEIFRQRGQERDIEKALAYYQKAISIDPYYSDPYRASGLVHYKEGQKALAKEFFESCLLLAPDTPDKAYIQGYIKQCMDDGEG
jgi:Zn-dependent protease with chaperone function